LAQAESLTHSLFPTKRLKSHLAASVFHPKRKVLTKMKKNQTGFSMVELLIVVTILGIVAAIAIPNMIASRRAANEGSAASAIRTIYNAEATYITSSGNGNYASLETLLGEKLIDSGLGTATAPERSKSGYYFEVTLFPGSNPPQLDIRGIPMTRSGPTATGNRTFWSGESGIIYYNENAEDINIEKRLPTNAKPLD
jgi:type IV pilus assembly protein PilA